MKKMAKLAVLDFWMKKLRDEVKCLKSLRYFKADFMSLTVCHPLLGTCISCPWETDKVRIQLILLSRRYPLESLTKYWVSSHSSSNGNCSLPFCSENSPHEGNVENFLLYCPSLHKAREKCVSFVNSYLHNQPWLSSLVNNCLESSPLQFLLDCSSMPQVVSEAQVHGDLILFHLFNITRNYCFI